MASYLFAMALAVAPLFEPAQKNEARDLYARGVESYNVGRFIEAAELLSRAAALGRNVPDYRYHLGLVYLKLGRAKEAARELEAALGMMGMSRDTRVKEPLVLAQAAVAYFRMGALDTARDRAEAALEREPGLAEAHYVRGLIAQREGDSEMAERHFHAVLELDRDHPGANVALAEAQRARGQLPEARENLRRAAHGASDNFEILMALGALDHELGELDEAEEAFRLALEARPDDERARFNLGTLYVAREQFSDAVRVLEPLAEGDEPRADARFNMAVALERSGNPERARDVLARLLDDDPEYEGGWFTLGLVLEALDETGEAEAAYQSAIGLRPPFLPAYLNLAVLLERAGRPGEALEVLERARSLPMDPAQLGAVEEAIVALESVRR